MSTEVTGYLKGFEGDSINFVYENTTADIMLGLD